MSRSGYTDEYEWLDLWRGSVDRAMRGARGQRFLRTIVAALDALPEKRLIREEFVNEMGEVCALGAVDPQCPADPYDREALAAHFNIAPAMAAEIMSVNDDWWAEETPEQRWVRMLVWVEGLITTTELNGRE